MSFENLHSSRPLWTLKSTKYTGIFGRAHMFFATAHTATAASTTTKACKQREVGTNMTIAFAAIPLHIKDPLKGLLPGAQVLQHTYNNAQ